MHTIRRCLLAWLLIPTLSLAANRLEPGDVPEPLRPWVDWVIFEHPDLSCPFLYNSASNRRCAWPGQLQLELQSNGGRFDASWEVFANSWLTLPGNREIWPQGVRLDDEAAVIVDRDGRPALHVGAGNHRIEGRFDWDSVPESLTVPRDSGLIRLRINGRDVAQPEIDRNGRIWLRDLESGRAATDSAAKNRVTLTVLRRIVDDNPLELYTRVEFEVTGDQRERNVGAPLPPAFIPISIDSTLPTRLDADGSLTVQLRPGRHVVTLRARHPQPLTEISNAAQSTPWPSTETWVFEARNNIRVVEIEGVQSVDPRQTRVPEQWRHLPAFVVAAGDAMQLVVTRRGDPDPAPDKLSLTRELWLDFDGGGYTTHDYIAGRITRKWRLDSGADLDLGQVVIHGEPQFITRLEPDGHAGVEVRRGQVDLRADGRMGGDIDRFGVTGWTHDFQDVQATLKLPPGWDVFAIGGVDNIPDTWLNRWTLLDLFLVLIVSAAVLRLWHWRGAVIALITTALIWHAPDAPRYVWIHLLVAIALLRVLPLGKFKSLVVGYRNVTALVLILISIPFVVQQLRMAAYPQLAQPANYVPPPAHAPASVVVAEDLAVAMEESPAMTMEFADEIAHKAPAPSAAGKLARRGAVGGGRAERGAGDVYGLDPDAIVQTGPGLPNWQWRQVNLKWNGPVDQAQELSISYIPPTANMILNVARVVLLIALLMVVAGLSAQQLVAAVRRGTIAALMLLAGGASLYTPSPHAGELPDRAMLEELKQRLLAPPECAEQCADITRMRIDVNRSAITMRLEVHAVEATAIPLPGNAHAWLPETVLVNDVQTSGLSRDHGGSLWQQLPAGVHQILVRGAMPQRGSMQIALPLRPRFGEVAAIEGWIIEGLRDDGRVEAQLQLTRADDGTAAQRLERFEKVQLPPFVRVERTIRLGLDWTVTTRVVRVVGGDNAVVLSVLLLDGESVITPDIVVENGEVQVNIPHNRNSVVWQSVLSKRETITLSAPTTTAWSETWRLRAGPIWHVSLTGIAPVHHQGEGDRWLPEWRPWPSESIGIAITRPQGISGQTMTIDSSVLQVKPGKRATENTLNIRLRSSKGGQYTLQLPAAANLQAVNINGVAQPIRAEHDRLTLPVTPGAQQITVAWRDNAGVVSNLRTPAIDLNIPSINHQIELVLGRDRWTLLTFGPRLGPAVLFWSLLAALLLTALGLSRVPITPLKTHEWLLLIIGLSQLFPLSAMVVIWLVALGLRDRASAQLSGARFNMMQIGLGLLTVAALAVLIEAIRQGLLGQPDMHVAGNGSSAHHLIWYADRVAPTPPTAVAVTVPILVYRLLMLAWALWLALAIVRWLRWGWSCFARGGLWQVWRQPKGADEPSAGQPAT